MKTQYQKWFDREQGYTNLGGFQTSLFFAYGYADESNKVKLEQAFPTWFTIAPQISPDQIDSDKNLQAHLQDRRNDLVWIEKELMEQALIDAKSGNGKSARYIALESNEKQLKANIQKAEQELGNVEERIVTNPGFTKQVSEVINNLLIDSQPKI